ncbi:MAG: DUF5668 domain-containing protein [Bryobacteraceae bacterium]|nr:DUF5668 domain-containing protein [Bryobacteraceae bacterium]
MSAPNIAVPQGTYLQAIRGPVMLITLGSLLAIDQLGSISFWRTWPALIIIFGLMKLFERVGAGPLTGGVR